MILPFLITDVAHAKGILRTEVAQTVAGRPFLAGVEVRMDPHWHVYWQNPGDSGVPTTVEWKAPKGWKVEPLGYPVPKRFAPGGIAAYGYEGSVVFLAWVTPSARAGVLSAKAKWLVCRDACFPGGANVSQQVRVGKSVRASGAERVQLRAALRDLPVESTWPAKAWLGKKDIGLEIKPSGALPRGTAHFFPLESGIIDHGKDAVATLRSGSVVFKMSISPFPESRFRLRGLLVAPKGTKWPGGRTALIVDARLEKGDPR
jgi:DsbC/DsbD-like thiol-disulfide interchange protein